MAWQPDFQELRSEIQGEIDHFGGALPERVALVWWGYLAGLTLWDLISAREHTDLTSMLPQIEDNPVLVIFTGREFADGAGSEEAHDESPREPKRPAMAIRILAIEDAAPGLRTGDLGCYRVVLDADGAAHEFLYTVKLTPGGGRNIGWEPASSFLSDSSATPLEAVMAIGDAVARFHQGGAVPLPLVVSTKAAEAATTPAPRRGPSRFIDGVPAAYRQLDLVDSPVPPQVAEAVAAAEYDMGDFRDQKPRLILHGGGPRATAPVLEEGLRAFRAEQGRPTWLEVSYFTGVDLMPILPETATSAGPARRP